MTSASLNHLRYFLKFPRSQGQIFVDLFDASRHDGDRKEAYNHDSLYSESRGLRRDAPRIWDD